MPTSSKNLLSNQRIFLQSLFFGGLVLSLFEFNLRFLATQPLFYLLISALATAGIVGWKFPKFLSPNARFNGLFILLASGFMVLSLYGPLLQARWGVIDDHEVMNYLGQDGKLTLKEWGQYVSQSGASKPGISLRYRPVYDVFRLTEVGLWDTNPQLWYAVRLGVLILFIAVAWYVSQSLLGFIGGGLLAVYILTSDYWKDIVGRLGPSEIYVALGLLIFSFFTHKLSQAKQHWTQWLGIFVGFVIMIGAKENVVLLAPLLLVPASIAYKQKKFSKTAAIYSILGLAFATFVGLSILIATTKTGQDVYAQSTDATSRLSVAILSLKTHQSKQLLVSLLLTFLFYLLALKKAKSVNLTKPTLQFVLVQIGCLGMFITQFIFYNGYWPDHNRYDFPGVLYLPIYFIALVVFLKSVLEKTKLAPQNIFAMIVAVYIGVICIIVMRGVVGIQVAVEQNVVNTTAYTSRIKQLAIVLSKDPTTPVILESANVWDYEPIYSYTVFLRAHGVNNPFFLKLNGYDSETVNPGLEHNLAKELKTIEKQGDARFLPLSQVDLNNCYSLIISGNTSTKCTPL